MKILEERYPLKSLKKQVTDGRYIDGFLWDNLKVLGRNIVRDMTYLMFISSSTLEVGTGKSVFAQQIAEAYLEAVRQEHKIDNKLTMNNIVFRPEELMKRAFKVPQYSVIILDEWEDTHYWSELGMSLRQFFRKCRQLNLFMICIIPNFFQLPPSYAISRSVAFIDVKFSGEFQRGYFSFYNFDAKKNLYIIGKKTQNYKVVKPNFTGRFADGYVVPEKEYRRAKYLDMINSEKNQKKKPTEKEITIKLFKQIYNNLDGITIKELAKGFGVSLRTGSRWLSKENDNKPNETELDKVIEPHITLIPTSLDDNELFDETDPKDEE
jgi:hypothetical protein